MQDRPRRLLYLVTEDSYFMMHRLPMARAAQLAGFEVHVATRVTRHGAAIEAEGFFLHPFQFARGSFNPLQLAAAIVRLRTLCGRLQPDLVHHVSLQAVLTGAFAALGRGYACLNGFTGLGYVYTAREAKARLARLLLRFVLPPLLNQAHTRVLVENADDREVLAARGVRRERIAVCPGSGIDIERFMPLPEPDGPPRLAFVGRILAIKGIRDLIAAHEILAARGRAIELLIAGLPDPANPSAVTQAEIERWAARPGITWLGQVEDVRTVWACAHIAVLPSHGGEGVPLALLEAAACGRPIIATDVPGCRDIARPEVSALLVPPRDPAALADAIERLIGDPDLRRRLGAGGRRLATDEFSSLRVGRDVVALYEQLVA